MGRGSALCALSITIALCAALAGCGKKEAVGATADATAQAFAAALEAGEYDRAAAAFDYADDARKQFEDWDSLPSSQRELITRKTAEQKAEELKTLKQRLGSGVKAGQAQGGITSVTGGSGSVSIQLAARKGKWYITALW